ncbi:MAG: PilW family protein [Capsulimonadaceae bacterium]
MYNKRQTGISVYRASWSRHSSQRRACPQSAFTLVEVLIVIAISVILFALLMQPLIDSLQYTRDAQLASAAQDSARKTIEIMSREIGSAAYVYDNTSLAMNQQLPNPIPPLYPGVQLEQYTNFLDLQVPTDDPTTGQVIPVAVDANGNSTASGQLAHAYNAKIDLVMPLNSANGNKNLEDPTTGDNPVTVVGATGTAAPTPTAISVPIAPGTTVIRYFIGLENPDKPYCNVQDGIKGTTQAPNNTYVLYRVAFQPYVGGGTPNPALFFVAPHADAASDGSGGSISPAGTPIFDDPDFFRKVFPGDVDWMRSDHGIYDVNTAQLHNQCYENWKMIAKPIISAPAIDLLTLPRNGNATGVKLAFDGAGPASATDEFPGVAHSGADQDDVPNPAQLYPIVTTSVTFLPGIYTTDMTPGTTLDYAQIGIGSVPLPGATTAGIPYVPTVYDSTGAAWTRPYTITMVSPSKTYIITPATYSITTTGSTGATYMSPGDIVESDTSTSPPTPVYNLTPLSGVSPFIPVGGGAPSTDVIPCAVNEDTGQINFSVPAILSPTQPYSRRWNYSYPGATPGPWGSAAATNVLDLTQVDTTQPTYTAGQVSPLNNYSGTIGKPLNYAFIVPGSVQVYGPDTINGPNYYMNANSKNVLYTPVANGDVQPGDDQYSVDYVDGLLMFGFTAPLSTAGPNGAPVFNVSYNYQSNVRPGTATAPVGPSNATTTANPAQPLVIQVQYSARDVIALHVGVRYLDAVGVPQNSVLTSSVKVGNMNH